MTQRNQLRSLFGSHDSGHARNFERIAFRIAGKLSEYLGTNAYERMGARSTPGVGFIGDVHHAWAPARIEVRQLIWHFSLALPGHKRRLESRAWRAPRTLRAQC